MQLKRILILEDDRENLNDLKEFFEKKEYKVYCAETVSNAERILELEEFDCAIFDINLPDDSGINLCLRVRQKTSMPIIFLSAYSNEDDRIKGLLAGANDYMCKPYSLKELELRVSLRINDFYVISQQKEISYEDFAMYPSTRTVICNGKEVGFSSFEFDVLLLLANSPNTVFTYDQIYLKIWKAPINKGVKSLQMMIVRIRQKLMKVSPEHDYLQTVRNKGYLFVPKNTNR